MSSVQTKPNLIEFPQRHATQRVSVSGKYFHLDGQSWSMRGLAYGPFGSDRDGQAFASEGKTKQDFELIRAAGCNTVRVYHVPPAWFLERAGESGLKVWVDIPWGQHHAFLDSKRERRMARESLMRGVRALGSHPALFAVCLGNEISSELVRWQGAKKVAALLDETADQVHQQSPELLCTYGNFPPTEYMRLESMDFLTFNVYLHEPEAMDRYLARLQLIADGRPLVVGEFGMDTLSEGKTRQADFLRDQLQVIDRNACAGSVIFSFTDDWYKDDQPVTDWAFGITETDRTPKPAYDVLKNHYTSTPSLPGRDAAFISVVIAAYNAGDTLEDCLRSLQRLDYPHYEVIVVDDGSTDGTRAIAAAFSEFQCIELGSNRGLSAARNAGVRAAKGELIAFTDADCQVDPQWLRFLAAAFESNPWDAVGGPNILPPDDGPVAAAVMATPGGPAHVMISDRVAEHIPGCNMAFRADVLKRLGGFDPQFRIAGDDVDICWRLLKQGSVIGFAPGAFVWHHRRSTVRAFVKQQMGYGRAESLLCRKFPSMFNTQGDHVWTGRIYAERRTELPFESSRIYHGMYGYGAFQPLYGSGPSLLNAQLMSVDYHLQTTLPLLLIGMGYPVLWVPACLNMLATWGVALRSAFGAHVPAPQQRTWSRLLLVWLHWVQPFSRSLARLQQWTRMRRIGTASRERMEALCLTYRGGRFDRAMFWNETEQGRPEFFATFRKRLRDAGWDICLNAGWEAYDAWIPGGLWFDLLVYSVDEYFQGGRRRVLLRLETRQTLLTRCVGLSLLGGMLALPGILGLTGWCVGILMFLSAGSFLIYRQWRRKLLAECLVELVENADALGWDLMLEQSGSDAAESKNT